MESILEFEFIRNAILAAILASIACGIIGSYVIVKRLVSISGSIAHSAFGGIGLGYFLGVDPMVAVIPFSLVCAVGIGWISKKTKLPADTAIGIFWALGMAIGAVLISLTPGYAPDLFSYLFGNILTVPRTDLMIMGILDLIIVSFVVLFYKQFLVVAFDEEYAEAIGLKVNFLYFLLLCLIALTVVVLIRIVGTILVIALLTIPAATAKQYIKNFHQLIVLSILIGTIFTLFGLWLSCVLDLASGATVILFSSVVFILTALIQRFRRRIAVFRT